MREDFTIGAIVIWVTFAAATGIADIIGAVFASIFVISIVFISYGFGTDIKSKDFESVITSIDSRIKRLSQLHSENQLRLQSIEARLLIPEYISICKDLFDKLEPMSQERALSSPSFKSIYDSGNANPSSLVNEAIKRYVFEMNMCLSALPDETVQNFRNSAVFDIYRKVTEFYSDDSLIQPPSQAQTNLVNSEGVSNQHERDSEPESQSIDPPQPNFPI